MNRDREWDFIDEAHHKLSEEKTLLATFAIVVKELAIKCPNNMELGEELRQLIQKYKLNTNN